MRGPTLSLARLSQAVALLLCIYVDLASASDECCGSGCGSAAPAGNESICAAALRPKKPPTHALKFCHIFPDESCCLPAQDAEIEEHYFNLLDAGDICAKESSMAKDALKKIFCASCSPEQPTYVDAATNTFKICSSLAKRVRPTCFDDCGMVRVAERGNLCAGDDVVVPSKTWWDCADGNYADSAGETPAGDAAIVFNGDECVPVTTPNTAVGGTNLTACCDKETEAECGDKPPYSCTGFWKFINDDTGAKPPFLEDYNVAIVKCDPEDADYDGTVCSTICYTGAAGRAVVAWAFTISAMVITTFAASL